MRQVKYQGGFEHPVRAFLIGASLLVLLFGGFVVGVEAGTHPLEQTVGGSTRVVTRSAARTVTVPTPVVRTVIRGTTRVVQLPGATRTRLVVIHDHGKTIFAYEPPQPPGSTNGGSPLGATPPTVFTVPAETVTAPPVTEPPVTVTVTVTDTSGTTDTQPTTSTTGP